MPRVDGSRQKAQKKSIAAERSDAFQFTIFSVATRGTEGVDQSCE